MAFPKQKKAQNDFYSGLMLLTPMYLLTLLFGSSADFMMNSYDVRNEKAKYKISAVFRSICMAIELIALGGLYLFATLSDQSYNDQTASQSNLTLLVLLIGIAFCALFPYFMIKYGKKNGLIVSI